MKTSNQTQFHAALVAAYSDLFKSDPRFAPAAASMTPEALAEKMINAAIAGTANLTGPGFRMACKACGIAHTGKAIDSFLGVASPAPKPAVVIMTPKTRKVSTLILSGIHSMMTGVFRINYAHGLVTLEYTDGKTEAAQIDAAKWAEISEKPFDIVSFVQAQRIPATL